MQLFGSVAEHWFSDKSVLGSNLFQLYFILCYGFHVVRKPPILFNHDHCLVTWFVMSRYLPKIAKIEKHRSGVVREKTDAKILGSRPGQSNY